MNDDQRVFASSGIPQVVGISADEGHRRLGAIIEGEQHLGAYGHGGFPHLSKLILTQW